MEFEEFRLSLITTDKKLGTWWAVGTHNQWFEFRITKGGKIRLFGIKKGKHPYFTKNKKS